jgi:hypothetical protein
MLSAMASRKNALCDRNLFLPLGCCICKTKNVAPYIPLFATAFLCNLDTYITRPSASLNPHGSHNFTAFDLYRVEESESLTPIGI